MSETQELLETFEKVDGGYIIKKTEDYVVDVRRMLFNWRVQVYPPNQEVIIWHAYCYEGLGVDTLLKAIGAALSWEDPIDTSPEGFSRQAF